MIESAGYKYIAGAKIKNETDEIKSQIFSLEKRENVYCETVGWGGVVDG
jgi:hypothetical protein